MYYRTKFSISDVIEGRPLPAFSPVITSFLSKLSVSLLSDSSVKEFPDLAHFAFFIREKNLKIQKLKYFDEADAVRLGLGPAFHIAPSNVPLNFAYSLVSALLCGNPSIVRISSTNFLQAEKLIEHINEVLEIGSFPPFLTIIQYDHDAMMKSRQISVNEYLSQKCKVRLLWGGDKTITYFKQISRNQDSVDITFPNKYSICLIDGKSYLAHPDKEQIARRFYADAYTFDQNGCSSPRCIFWITRDANALKAQDIFWKSISEVIAQNEYQTGLGVGVRHVIHSAKLAVEKIGKLSKSNYSNNITLFNIKNQSHEIFLDPIAEGFFFQTEIASLDEIDPYISDKCQTLTYFGDIRNDIKEYLYQERPKGIDRVVEFGQASNFDLNWDGKELVYLMTKRLL